MATVDVFISYSSLDLRIAEGLRMVLVHAGHTVWFDRHEVRAGEQVPNAIRKALRRCRFLCAIITPNYGKTWYTRMEAEFMRWREGILAPERVIPCLISGDVPVFLGERSYIDFRSDWQRAEKRLLADLASHKKVQDDRSTLFGVGAVIVAAGIAAVALSGDSDEQIAARRGMLECAKHPALGRLLSTRGIPAPSKKVDRVASVLENVPMAEALDELFSPEQLGFFCDQLRVPRGRSKAERIRNILG